MPFSFLPVIEVRQSYGHASHRFSTCIDLVRHSHKNVCLHAIQAVCSSEDVVGTDEAASTVVFPLVPRFVLQTDLEGEGWQ